MHVAVDQSRRQRGSFSVDRSGRAADIHILFFPDALNHAIDRDHGIGIQNRAIDIPAEQQPDVADNQLV